MADRAVRRTGKTTDGDITFLCDTGHAWSPRSKSDAISDIESGLHTYHVPWTSGRTEIRVVVGTSGKYLRTDRDSTTKTTWTTCRTAEVTRKSHGPAPDGVPTDGGSCCGHLLSCRNRNWIASGRSAGDWCGWITSSWRCSSRREAGAAERQAALSPPRPIVGVARRLSRRPAARTE